MEMTDERIIGGIINSKRNLIFRFISNNIVAVITADESRMILKVRPLMKHRNEDSKKRQQEKANGRCLSAVMSFLLLVSYSRYVVV